jgi:outer membrane protein assembly factor BamB
MFVYVSGEEDPVKQYHLIPDTSPGGAGWKFESGNPPYRTSPVSAPYPNFPNGEFGQTGRDPVWMPGGFLALSANGTTDGTGILWVAMPLAGNANHLVVRGVLRAFDASDVSKPELWDSESTGNQNDRLGQFAKFCPPTVANGKVYMATFQQENVTASGQHVKAQGGDQPALVIYGPR